MVVLAVDDDDAYRDPPQALRSLEAAKPGSDYDNLRPLRALPGALGSRSGRSRQLVKQLSG